MTLRWFAPSALYLLLLLSTTLPPFIVGGRKTDHSDWKPVVNLQNQSALFEPSALIAVPTAPSNFPPPHYMLGPKASIIANPTFGEHRPDKDAILAYAEGYKLSYYRMFLETLKDSGYEGDVVLAIAEERILRPHVLDYLKAYSEKYDEPNLVVYQQQLKCESRTKDVDDTHRQILKSGDTDIFQMCQLPFVYGVPDNDGKIQPQEDPREGRVVATIRYEWYWIWSRYYQPDKWLMLIDMRDSYFQSNPFVGLPRYSRKRIKERGGLLYFFGENPDATRLGQSRKNRKWIYNGYGPYVFDALKDKPTICSGSTMGHQVAIDTYLRALINEHDENDIRMTGSDQGFHNYLYYSSKLVGADTIDRLILWEQGRGIINNVGALRTKPFSVWGFYNPATHVVYQWDGKTPSPVVHQWDRDKDLHGWMNGEKHRAWTQEWQDGQAALQQIHKSER